MTEPLRVLRLTPHFFRPDIWPVAYDPVGGLQIQVWRLTGALDRVGLRQVVLTSHIPGSARRMRPFPSTRVECVGLSLPGWMASTCLNFSWFLAAVLHLIRQANQFDVVHIHYNHSVWCRVLAFVAARRGVPLVVTLNTALWGGLAAALRNAGIQFDVIRWIERWGLKGANSIIALTGADATRKAESLGLPKERLVVVPDAIDVEEFSAPVDPADIAQFRIKHRIPDGRPVVTYVGRISDEKGSADLPRLTCDLSPAGNFLLICGDGPDRAKLEAELRAAECGDAWRITGFLPPAEVKLALAVADVLVLPSHREAFGSVLLEAMAAGVPAAAYGVGGIVEVAGTPNAVSLVEPADPRALAQRIGKILSDAKLRETLVERGRKRVRDFPISASAEKTLAIYRMLCAARSIGDSGEELARSPGPGVEIS